MTNQTGSPAASEEDAAGEDPHEMTLNEWLDIWLSEYLSDVKPGTQESYDSVCRHYLRPVLGSIPLNQLKAPAIQKMYNTSMNSVDLPRYLYK